jgi:type IV pilus assembly protein PilN
MKPSLNLASRTYLNRRLLYVGYTVAIFLLLSGLAGFGYYFWNSYQTSRSIHSTIDQMQQQSLAAKGGAAVPFSTEEYQRVLKRISFFNAALEKNSFSWTHLLGRLEVLVPNGVGLSSIQPDFHGRSLKITGLARNLDKLQGFLDNLLAAKDFSAVYLLNQARQSPAKGRTGGEELSFSIVLEGAF